MSKLSHFLAIDWISNELEALDPVLLGVIGSVMAFSDFWFIRRFSVAGSDEVREVRPEMFELHFQNHLLFFIEII